MTYDHTNTLLEDVYQPITTPYLPLVVFDFKVYAHNINKFAESAAEVARDEKDLATIMKAMWAYKLNRGPDMLQQFPFVGVVVDDLKGQFSEDFAEASTTGLGYWRHVEAHKLSLAEYKGGRGEKTPLFDITEKAGYDYIKASGSTFPIFSKAFFEADDWAGLICRLRRNAPSNSALAQRQIILSTVDGDWQGLVSDAHDIVWANTGPWLPRLRSEREVCDYYLRKDKQLITKAKECYNVKEKLGDSGDNLAPSTPLRFFDLYEEDNEWRFSEEDTEAISQVLESNSASNREDHFNSAKRYLRSRGLFYPEVGETDSPAKQIFFERAEKARLEKEVEELRGKNKTICLGVAGKVNDLKKCKELALQDEELKESIKIETVKLDECKEAEDKKCVKEIRAIIKSFKDLRKTIKESLLEFVSGS